MTELSADQFFDLGGFGHRDLFADGDPVWSALGSRLQSYLDDWSAWQIEIDLPAGVHLLGERIAIAPGCRIEPGAVIIGPAILESGVTVRTGAYIRERVVLGAGSLVGAHTEVKGSVLLPGAKAPHQNYVGDSLLGRDVNLGAGTILSNVKNIGREVTFTDDGSHSASAGVYPQDGTTYYWWVWAANGTQWCSPNDVITNGGRSFVNGT